MKDYIVLTFNTATANTDNSLTWQINASSFKSMKQNDRLKVKINSCGAIINNGTLDAIPGVLIFYCNLLGSNITTDSGQGILGTAYSDTKLLSGDYYIYTTGFESSIEINTNPFYNITIWSTDDSITKHVIESFVIVLEISYYQN